MQFSARRKRIKFCQPETNEDLTYGMQPRLREEIHFSSEIRGMTVVESEIFIVCENSNVLDVYNAETSGFKFKLLVPGLNNPGSFVGTSTTLYISEYRGTDIFRVTMQNGKFIPQTLPWTIRGSKFIRLSTTKQGNVLASCDCLEGKTGDHSYKLCEYTTNGNLIKEILLPPMMLKRNALRHAVQIDDNRYLVICFSGLNLVDENGALINSYGGDLYGAQRFVVDRNGFILVGCSHPGEKIVLLNSEMEFVRDIIPQEFDLFGKVDKFHKVIYVDEYHKKLYIQRNIGILQVFSLQ